MIDRRIVTRYSETFKRKVVGELESGVLSSVSDARRRYGIPGALTVQGWIKRLGKNHLLGKVVRVETLEEGREIERRRRSGPRTTDSRHGFRVYENLLKSAELKGPHEAWVSDLTYLRTRERFLYLALVMDAWSRKIVGWHVGGTLEALGCVAAVRMALGQIWGLCVLRAGRLFPSPYGLQPLPNFSGRFRVDFWGTLCEVFEGLVACPRAWGTCFALRNP